MEELRGTGVALATPMKKDYSVDREALEKLVNHTLNGGVDYLVVMGTTGESPVFSWKEKLQILEWVTEFNNNRKPIVFGLGGNHTYDLIEKSKELKSFDLAAILSVSPYYNKPSQEGIKRHYQLLADAFPRPIIMYNVPSRTASNVEAQTTVTLASHPNIVAMKEASGDLKQCKEIAAAIPSNFHLLSGDDAASLDIMDLGGSGVISVAANVIPEDFCTMINLQRNGQQAEARKLNDKLQKAYKLLTEEGNPSSLKAGLEAIKIGARTVKPPLFDASDILVAKWDSYFSS